jgi:hypothetical protein
VDCALGMQPLGSRLGITAVSAAHFQPQNRLAFAFGFEWTANRNRTDCKALTSDFKRNSLVRFCYLQLTDVSRLTVAKPDRGFESLSLRHTV